MSEKTINLETEGNGALTFREALQRMPQRSDVDCDTAWEFFDDLLPGETMDIINKFAALGWSTPKIYAQVSKFFPPEAHAWPPRMHEMMALCTESAVRKAKL